MACFLKGLCPEYFLDSLPFFDYKTLYKVMNYLKASGLTVGLLLNFGVAKLGIRRMVWNYDDKNNRKQ